MAIYHFVTFCVFATVTYAPLGGSGKFISIIFIKLLYHLSNLPPISGSVIVRCSHNEFTAGCSSCCVMLVLSFNHRRKDWEDYTPKVKQSWKVKLEKIIDSLAGNTFSQVPSGIKMSISAAAAMLLVSPIMSQRGYKKLRKRLKAEKMYMDRYEVTKQYINDLSVVPSTLFLRRTEMTSLDCDMLEKAIKLFYHYLKQTGSFFQESQSVYLHVILDDILIYARFWLQFGIGLGMFWSSPGEHCNKLNKQDEMRRSNFTKDKYRNMLHHRQSCIWHYPLELQQVVRKNYKCTACGLRGHIKSNQSCEKFIRTGSNFSVDEYFSQALLLSNEERCLMEQRKPGWLYPDQAERTDVEFRFAPPDDDESSTGSHDDESSTGSYND